MCTKNFENRFTNTKNMSKINFEQGIFYRKIARKGSNYFPGKFHKPYYFIVNVEYHHQMSQKT